MSKERKEILIWRAISIVLLAILVSLFVKDFLKSSSYKSEIKKELMLTPTEDLALKEVYKKYKEKHRAIRKERRAADKDLNDALSSQRTTEEELREKFLFRTGLRKKSAEQRFNMSLEIRKVVGPERMKIINKYKGLRRFKKGKRKRGKSSDKKRRD